jgi:hypothetical protein
MNWLVLELGHAYFLPPGRRPYWPEAKPYPHFTPLWGMFKAGSFGPGLFPGDVALPPKRRDSGEMVDLGVFHPQFNRLWTRQGRDPKGQGGKRENSGELARIYQNAL